MINDRPDDWQPPIPKREIKEGTRVQEDPERWKEDAGADQEHLADDGLVVCHRAGSNHSNKGRDAKGPGRKMNLRITLSHSSAANLGFEGYSTSEQR